MQLLDKILVKLGHNIGLPSKYALLKRIGAGAEGEVWLGLDEESRTMVAIKLIPRGAPAWKLDMAKREFSMLCRLGPGHLNIVRPLELVLTSRHLVLITEYVPGGSLSDHLARHCLSEDVARYFFKQVLAAVAFCHARKIVYRDIKPANVLITGTKPPFLKLCDFGLADSWETRSDPSFKSLVGTPGYMAPEIMASFFTTAAEVARRSQGAAGPGTAAAADDDTVAAPSSHASSRAAAKVKSRKKAAVMLKPSASGKLTSKVVAAATAAAAAARAAVAAVPGSRGGSSGSLASGEDGDPEAHPELAAVMAMYDGQKADVFSLGVLLVVMMLRHMPWNYDSIAARLPLLKAMLALHELAVVNKVSWRDATSHADTLSPDLSALLDTMLEPDPQKRATLQQLADSPWVNAPLPHTLQCAALVIDEQQQAREQQYNSAMAAAAAQAGKSCFQECAVLSAAVQQQLDAMMAAAKSVGKGFKLEMRLSLMQLPQQLLQEIQQQDQQQRDGHAFQAEQPHESCDASSEECCTTAVISAPVATTGLDEAAANSTVLDTPVPTKVVPVAAASAVAVAP